MAELQHGSGKILKVDTENNDLLLNHSWKEDKHGLFYTRIDGKTAYLHRIVGGRSIGFLNHTVRVRFKDETRPEDCRLSNLDVTDYATQNQQRKVSSRKTSKYRGVYWWELKERWRAREYLYISGHKPKPVHIGMFLVEEDAARARDEWCKLHRPDAILNFPEV